MKLNEKGQCPNCLIKPLRYSRSGHNFCHRCCRSFDMTTGMQVENWAWRARADDFVSANPHNDYSRAKPTPQALRRSIASQSHSVKSE